MFSSVNLHHWFLEYLFERGLEGEGESLQIKGLYILYLITKQKRKYVIAKGTARFVNRYYVVSLSKKLYPNCLVLVGPGTDSSVISQSN